MKMLSALLGIALLIFPGILSAQIESTDAAVSVKRIVVTGLITDEETGEPISDVTVQAIETGFATKANAEGRYRLILPAGAYTFKASHIGHYSNSVQLTLDDGQVIQDFVLKSSIIDMGERKVYTRAYDPGQRIILEAIARKDDILSRIHDYQFEAYSRLVITDETKPDTAENDIILIAETQLTSFWERPDKYKEIINSRRQTANLPAEGNMVAIGEILNFNKNRIDINDYSVVSPTAEDALDHYNYYLTDTVYLDNKAVYVLEIEPRNEFEPLFVGEIHIADSTYEVVRVDVGFSKGISIPYIENGRYYQHYAEIDGKYWMPIEIGFICDVRLGLGFVGVPSHIGFSYVAAISDYKIEEGIPKKTFDEFQLEVSPTADDFDSTVWASRMVLPLTQEQERGYTYIDSVQHAPQAILKRAGRLLAVAPFVILFGDRDFFHYNRVDGPFLGIPIKRELTPDFKVTAINGYGFEDKKWQYTYGADARLIEDKNFWVGGSISDRIVSRHSITFAPELNETMAALFFGEDPNEYYRRKGYEFHASSRTVPRTSVSLGFESSRFYSKQRETDYAFFAKPENIERNISISEGRKRSLHAALRYDSRPLIKNKGRIEPYYTMNYIIATAALEYSSPDFADSDFDFKKYSIKLTARTNATGLGVTNLFGYAGTSEGQLPIQENYVSSFMDMGLMQTLGLITFYGDSYGGDRLGYVFVDHDFGKYMFRNSGINFLKRIPIGFSIHGGAMWTGITGEFTSQDLNLYEAPTAYTEVGFGLNNLTPFLGVINLSAKFSWQISDYDTRSFFGVNGFFDF
ncbi:MAG: DUF5686 family protein [Candidatus Zixiibacteriota bacterium]